MYKARYTNSGFLYQIHFTDAASHLAVVRAIFWSPGGLHTVNYSSRFRCRVSTPESGTDVENKTGGVVPSMSGCKQRDKKMVVKKKGKALYFLKYSQNAA